MSSSRTSQNSPSALRSAALDLAEPLAHVYSYRAKRARGVGRRAGNCESVTLVGFGLLRANLAKRVCAGVHIRPTAG